MNIFTEMKKPRRYNNGGFNAILDCGYSHNRWLEIALDYLPENITQNGEEEFVFTSTANRDACRVARHYCNNRELILISERILPSTNIVYQTDPRARYFIYVVLHEVAHAINKHKSPLFDNLSDDDFESQEKEADDLAMKWFNDHVRKINDLQPITKEEIKVAQEYQQQFMQKMRDGI